MRLTVFGIILMLTCVGTLTMVLNAPPVKASVVIIYLRADGSVVGTSFIQTADKVTYFFTADINFSTIIVQRSNIIIDGKGHQLNGPGTTPAFGFNLTSVSNVTVRSTNIAGFDVGPSVYLSHASSCLISRNNVTGFMGVDLVSSNNNSLSGNDVSISVPSEYSTGIFLESSNGNRVYENEIYSGNQGIYLDSSDNNSVFGNDILSCFYGMRFEDSSKNVVYGNNIGYGMIIILNADGFNLGSSSGNKFYHNNIPTSNLISNSTDEWDDGYPSGGNCWGGLFVQKSQVDAKSGPYQNETGSDGISDNPRVIDANNTDRYPLMGPYEAFNAGTWKGTQYDVGVISNSTLTDFSFDASMRTLSFNVTWSGVNETVGFCRVIIPTGLMWADTPDQWVVIVGGTLYSNRTVAESGNYSYIYFTYTQSTRTVQIQSPHALPEFQTFLILPLLMMTTLLAVMLSKKKRNARHNAYLRHLEHR